LSDLSVAPRHGHVVEEDVGVGMPPERRHRAVEHEGRSLVRAAADDEHPHTCRELVEKAADLGFQCLPVLKGSECDGGLVLVATSEWRAARGAVVGLGIVEVTTATASHRR
jgi:hypothetical protein